MEPDQRERIRDAIGQAGAVTPAQSSDLSSLALRTRLFAAALRRAVRPAETPAQMIALRERRERLLDTWLGALVFGRTARGVLVEDRAEGEQRFHLHRPATATGPLPIVLNLHGGGWCLGSPEQSEWLASNVAAQAGAVVVSPTYRLAPEHPYPAAVEDAWAALRWVHAHASEWGGDPARIVVMGDSAGGNLAAVLALKARAAGPAISAQVLIYPAVEMYDKYPSEQEFADAPVLTSEGMRRFGRLYLGERYGTEDWEASPLRALSCEGLPPTLIVSAAVDPLRDHSRLYAAALAEAGVQVEAHELASAIHGFVSLPGVVPAAREAVALIGGFLTRRIGVPAG